MVDWGVSVVIDGNESLGPAAAGGRKTAIKRKGRFRNKSKAHVHNVNKHTDKFLAVTLTWKKYLGESDCGASDSVVAVATA